MEGHDHRGIEAAHEELRGAEVFNFGGEVAAVREVAGLIESCAPGVTVGVEGPPIPTIATIVDNGLKDRFPDVTFTGLRSGVEQTVAFYRA